MVGAAHLLPFGWGQSLGPLGRGSQHSLAHPQRWGWRVEWTCLGMSQAGEGMDPRASPSSRPRGSLWCAFFMFTGAPLLPELPSYRAGGMGSVAKVFKSHPQCHQLEMTTVSVGRYISFLSLSDVRRELQLGFIFLWGQGSQVCSVPFCLPPSILACLEA